MQAVKRILAVGIKIERSRTKRIARPAVDLKTHARRFCVHPRRRCPARPFRLALDGRDTGPAEALPAHGNAVAQGGAFGPDEIEEARPGIDDNGAGRLAER